MVFVGMGQEYRLHPLPGVAQENGIRDDGFDSGGRIGRRRRRSRSRPQSTAFPSPRRPRNRRGTYSCQSHWRPRRAGSGPPPRSFRHSPAPSMYLDQPPNRELKINHLDRPTIALEKRSQTASGDHAHRDAALQPNALADSIDERDVTPIHAGLHRRHGVPCRSRAPGARPRHVEAGPPPRVAPRATSGSPGQSPRPRRHHPRQ